MGTRKMKKEDVEPLRIGVCHGHEPIAIAPVIAVHPAIDIETKSSSEHTTSQRESRPTLYAECVAKSGTDMAGTKRTCTLEWVSNDGAFFAAKYEEGRRTMGRNMQPVHYQIGEKCTSRTMTRRPITSTRSTPATPDF